LEWLRNPRPEKKSKNDPVQKSKDTEKLRKETQIENMKDYDTEKVELQEEIKENEGPDIREAMLKERRDWYTEDIQKKGGAIPTSLEDFYKRFDVEAPLTPEEEELKKQLEEEEAK
jgi:predicted HAD superfamily Cof-like phosphohydrolase